MARLWDIRLLGGVAILSGDYSISRFKTHKTALLLARLAHACPAKLSREQLAEQLWPESDPEVARSILRSMLSSLRRQLEPPGVMTGSVLTADRIHIGLDPGAVLVDTREFERLATAANDAGSTEARAELLEQASEQYAGELLPGFYEDWILWERDRLQRLHQSVLSGLAEALQELGRPDRALHQALRAISADPLNESAHGRVIQIYLDAGQPDEARQQYDRMSATLWNELESRPSPEVSALVAHLSPTGETLILPRDPKRQGRRQGRTTTPDRTYRPPADTEKSGWEPGRGRPVFQPDRFFGREDDLARLDRLLVPPYGRLITVIGPGGVGKTRLAAEFAEAAATTRSIPYWLVPLADLSDPELLWEEIARVLQFPSVIGATPFEELVITLSGRPSLLVLDNFEHLVEGGAEAVADLMAALPDLCCVVTSRQALEIAAEQLYRLEPLPVPAGPEPSDRLAEYAAVKLFVSRARRAVPDFHANERNAGALGALIARLEGLPLSIELAAGWAQTLTPAAMLERLGSRFDFLVSPRRDMPARHRALRATLDRSYAFLPPDLRRLLGQLSVFRGGFTVETTQEVCANCRAAERLRQLQAASMVSPVDREGEIRFRLPEALREYAGEQLGAAEHEDLQSRHLGWVLGLAQEAEKELTGREQVRWAAQLDEEYENIRAALEHALASDPTVALDLSGSLWRYWYLRGLLREGSRWLTQALDICEAPAPALRGKALNAAGILTARQGDTEGARRLYEESLIVFRELGDQRGIANALCNLASTLLTQKQFSRATTLYEEALSAYRKLNYDRGVILVTANLGVLAVDQKEYSAAKPLLKECALLSREAGNLFSEALALHNLGEALRGEQDCAGARTRYGQALWIFLELGERHVIAHTIRGLAAIYLEESEWQTAASLFCLADEIFREAGVKLAAGAEQELDTQLRALREHLDAGDWQMARERARTLDLHELASSARAPDHALIHLF
ncbi:MAG TPA: BTAD domain-containing putative transcriptional regulator [Armatimonadota bacterium]|nr:BTAD domain-containing putative transcriptional regulator [Armatimonadota bacterium]